MQLHMNVRSALINPHTLTGGAAAVAFGASFVAGLASAMEPVPPHHPGLAFVTSLSDALVLVAQQPEPEQRPAAETDGWDDDFNATEVAEDTEWAGEEAQQAERMKEKMMECILVHLLEPWKSWRFQGESQSMMMMRVLMTPQCQ